MTELPVNRQSANGEHHAAAPMLFGLRVVMLGRQGSGKGTQGMQLARLLVVPHISVGDPLHEASRSGSLADSGPGECTAGMSNLQTIVPPGAQVSI